mmetsp:Transcript_7528/g.31154  ORF Transcript_7528/g.31154 Transcript_7528/m.31154 type:complete len:300 (-) Transcript_7528:285-1184(-)
MLPGAFQRETPPSAGGKASTFAQTVLLRCSHVLSLVCLLLVLMWTSGTDSSTHLMLGGLSTAPDKVFNFHPLLMIAGFTVCMGEGLTAYRVARMGKPTNKRIHAAWHSAGIACVACALRAVWRSHDLADAPNLYTVHGIVGLAVCVLFFAQYLVAAVAFLSPLVDPARRGVILRAHVVAGVSIYLASLAAIVSGIAEKLAWQGCGYYAPDGDAHYHAVALRRPDTNPAAHYGLLPTGCRLGIGVGVTAFLAALCVVGGILTVKVGKETDTLDDDDSGPYHQRGHGYEPVPPHDSLSPDA